MAGQVTLNLLARISGIWGSHRSDLTWIERNFLPGFESLVKATRSPRVLDVDDALWVSHLLGKIGAKKLAKMVDAVIAGNLYLGEWYGQYCKNIHIIPTAIDCDRFQPRNENIPRRFGDDFIIGWTGTSGNFKYFELMARPLARFLKAHPTSKFLVLADRRPSLQIIPESQIQFIPWSSQNETGIIQQMDVGIMPLFDDEWTKGKCSFKMLQYMAAGIPVIVSPVGMNREVLAKGECGFGVQEEAEWYDALTTLFAHSEMREAMGKAGRKIAQAHYDIPAIAWEIAGAFKDILRV
jgi:glycosyltransferase involved in cell wall biosynthesis